MTEEKEKEYQEAILNLHGMTRHYLKFIQQSEETTPSRIEFKNYLIEIITNHIERFEHLTPKVNHENS